MGKSISSLFVDILANTQGLERDLRRMGDKLGPKMKAVGLAAGKALAAGLAAGVGTAAVLTKAGLESVDALAKTADKLGLATERLQALQHAAQLSGVSVQTFNMAMQRMTRRVAEAAQGTGEARGALAELGLDAQKLAALSPDEQMREIARAMGDVANQGDRVRLAMKLFDSEGVALVNMLGNGVEGLDAMTAEFAALGASINRVDASKVEQANDAITRLKVVLGYVSQQLAVQLAPLIVGITERLTEAAKQGGGMGAAIRTGIDVAITAAGMFADIIHAGETAILGLMAAGASMAQGLVGNLTFVASNIDTMVNTVIGGVEGLVNGVAATLETLLNLALQGVEKQVNSGIQAINTLISGVNRVADLIPGIEGQIAQLNNFSLGDVELGRVSLDRMGETGLEKWAKKANQTVANVAEAAREELSKALNAPWPSDRLDAWRAEVTDTVNETAIEVADKVAAIQAAPLELESATAQAGAAIETVSEKVESDLAPSLDRLGNLLGSNSADWRDWARTIGDVLGNFGGDGWLGQLSGLFNAFGGGNSSSGGGGFLGQLGGLASNFSGFFADGGTLGAGQWGIAGENGPEPVVGPAKVVPNGSAVGTTVVQHNHFAPGVSPADLAEQLRQSEGRIYRTLPELVQRGGAYREAFA